MLLLAFSKSTHTRIYAQDLVAQWQTSVIRHCNLSSIKVQYKVRYEVFCVTEATISIPSAPANSSLASTIQHQQWLIKPAQPNIPLMPREVGLAAVLILPIHHHLRLQILHPRKRNKEKSKLFNKRPTRTIRHQIVINANRRASILPKNTNYQS